MQPIIPQTCQKWSKCHSRLNFKTMLKIVPIDGIGLLWSDWHGINALCIFFQWIFFKFILSQ
jgi:hypothetical protein